MSPSYVTHTNHTPRRENFAAQREISLTKNYLVARKLLHTTQNPASHLCNIQPNTATKNSVFKNYLHTTQIKLTIHTPNTDRKSRWKLHYAKKFSCNENLCSLESSLSPMWYIHKSHIVTKHPPFKRIIYTHCSNQGYHLYAVHKIATRDKISRSEKIIVRRNYSATQHRTPSTRHTQITHLD